MVDTVDALLKDMYPLPGTPLKQWVVDQRRESQWESETCPRFTLAEHEDNAGTECRNSLASVPWTHLEHDWCYFCGDLHGRYEKTPEVQAWLAEKAKRPPVCADRSKLSGEVQADYPSMRPHPFFTMLPKERP